MCARERSAYARALDLQARSAAPPATPPPSPPAAPESVWIGGRGLLFISPGRSKTCLESSDSEQEVGEVDSNGKEEEGLGRGEVD